MARGSNETVRLLYHARTLVVSVVGVVGVVVSVAVAGGDIGEAHLGAFARPLLALTLALLAFLAWLGWTDYVSATSLAIDARGVTLGWPTKRLIAWSAMRGLSRGTGAFRLAIRTDAGKVRFQLLVLQKPIPALKQLVSEATSAGAKVEPYLTRLAEHVEEDSDEPEP